MSHFLATTLPLDFDICARKSGDPVTSHDANLSIAPRKLAIREKVYQLALARGAKGVTLHEVMAELNLSYPTASARLAELKAERLLTKTDERRHGCAVLTT